MQLREKQLVLLSAIFPPTLMEILVEMKENDSGCCDDPL